MYKKNNQSERSFKAGDTIMKQGEQGNSAYIIESGRVDILIENDAGKQSSIGTRGPGAMIGEMAIVDNAPRTATVKALEDCTLLEIRAEDFARRLANADPVLRMTIQVILTRYRDTLKRADISGTKQNWPPAEAVELDYASQSDAVHDIRLANDFQNALASREISLHYQPIVDLTTGNIKGYEALMRWEHPEKGFISPGVFIPVIEESGLIVTASRWALRESLLALKRIERKTGERNLYMSLHQTILSIVFTPPSAKAMCAPNRCIWKSRSAC